MGELDECWNVVSMLFFFLVNGYHMDIQRCLRHSHSGWGPLLLFQILRQVNRNICPINDWRCVTDTLTLCVSVELI